MSEFFFFFYMNNASQVSGAYRNWFVLRNFLSYYILQAGGLTLLAPCCYIDYVNSTRMMLHCSILAHVHLHVHTTSCSSTWPNQLAGQETRSFAYHLSCETCEGKKPETESAISVATTGAISSCESSSLANCRPLHVSAHCHMCSVQSAPRSKYSCL